MMDFIKGGCALLVGSVLLVVAIAAPAQILVEHMNLPGALSKIEQLREDARCVSAAESEDVIGQVTQANQTIREKQRYNDVWFAAWSIPNAWDNVATIPVPQTGRVAEGCQ